MNRVIERLCRCDAQHASHVLRIVKVWVAYVGILCLGGMIFGTPLYIWFDRSIVAADIAHQEEMSRIQEINADLMMMIRDRLPPIPKQSHDDAKKPAHAPIETFPDWLNSP